MFFDHNIALIITLLKLAQPDWGWISGTLNIGLALKSFNLKHEKSLTKVILINLSSRCCFAMTTGSLWAMAQTWDSQLRSWVTFGSLRLFVPDLGHLEPWQPAVPWKPGGPWSPCGPHITRGPRGPSGFLKSSWTYSTGGSPGLLGGPNGRTPFLSFCFTSKLLSNILILQCEN